jgi:hypothetical protein
MNMKTVIVLAAGSLVLVLAGLNRPLKTSASRGDVADEPETAKALSA